MNVSLSTVLTGVWQYKAKSWTRCRLSVNTFRETSCIKKRFALNLGNTKAKNAEFPLPMTSKLAQLQYCRGIDCSRLLNTEEKTKDTLREEEKKKAGESIFPGYSCTFHEISSTACSDVSVQQVMPHPVHAKSHWSQWFHSLQAIFSRWKLI